MKKVILLCLSSVAACFLVGFLFSIAVDSQHAQGKSLYMITVHTFRGDNTYIASEVKKQDSACATFISTFGIEQTVCGSYTISKY